MKKLLVSVLAAGLVLPTATALAEEVTPQGSQANGAATFAGLVGGNNGTTPPTVKNNEIVGDGKGGLTTSEEFLNREVKTRLTPGKDDAKSLADLGNSTDLTPKAPEAATTTVAAATTTKATTPAGKAPVAGKTNKAGKVLPKTSAVK